jgi:hypothetical protein
MLNLALYPKLVDFLGSLSSWNLGKTLHCWSLCMITVSFLGPIPPPPKAATIGLLSYPTFKTHFKNGDSYQVMTQAIRQEPLLTTLHPLPTGSRIMGGQEKSQCHLGWGNPGQPPRLDCFRSTTEVSSNAQPYPEEHTAPVDKNLEYL